MSREQYGGKYWTLFENHEDNAVHRGLFITRPFREEGLKCLVSLMSLMSLTTPPGGLTEECPMRFIDSEASCS
jgi:hypothetical protein